MWPEADQEEAIRNMVKNLKAKISKAEITQ